MKTLLVAIFSLFALSISAQSLDISLFSTGSSYSYSATLNKPLDNNIELSFGLKYVENSFAGRHPSIYKKSLHAVQFPDRFGVVFSLRKYYDCHETLRPFLAFNAQGVNAGSKYIQDQKVKSAGTRSWLEQSLTVGLVIPLNNMISLQQQIGIGLVEVRHYDNVNWHTFLSEYASFGIRIKLKEGANIPSDPNPLF